MRPQARVLLAIGAVVLAGLVAWVLIPHEKTAVSTTPDNSSTLSPPPASLPPTTTTAETPSTLPAGDAFAPPTATTLPGAAADGMSTTAPAARTDNNDPWGMALDENRTHTAGDNAFGGRVDHGDNATRAPGAGTDMHTGPATPRTYTVKAGDSLYVISQRVLGSPKYVAAIQKANPKVDPKRLKVGQVLNMPDVSGSSTPAPAPGASRTAAGGSAHSATPSPSTGKTYTVQPGDTLSKIATKIYGSTEMWEKIYALNRAAIGASPTNLRVGMTLRLPEAPAAPAAPAAH